MTGCVGAWEEYELRMTLRFLTEAAGWTGAVCSPFTDTWVTGKEEWILGGKMAGSISDVMNSSSWKIAVPANKASCREWIF